MPAEGALRDMKHGVSCERSCNSYPYLPASSPCPGPVSYRKHTIERGAGGLPGQGSVLHLSKRSAEEDVEGQEHDTYEEVEGPEDSRAQA